MQGRPECDASGPKVGIVPDGEFPKFFRAFPLYDGLHLVDIVLPMVGSADEVCDISAVCSGECHLTIESDGIG